MPEVILRSWTLPAQQSGVRAPASLARRLCAALLLAMGALASGSACANPANASRFYEDALQRFEKKDFDGAVVQLKNALQQDEKMLAAHLLLAKALARTGNLSAAEAALNTALRYGAHPGEVMVPLGHLYLAMRYPNKVIELVSPTGLRPALQVEVLALRGTAYAEVGQPGPAGEAFAQARAIDPKSPIPLIAEVPFLIAQGQNAKAVAAAVKAVEVAPNNAFAWNSLGVARHAVLDLAGAMVAYGKALSLDPGLTDARIARAAFLIESRREAEATKDLDYIKAASVDAPSLLLDPRIPYLRALLAKGRGDAVALKAALKEVVTRMESLSPEWLNKQDQLLMVGAHANQGLGNFAKAREYLEIIIQRNASNLGARKLLASIYVNAREFARAQPLLESLQKVIPDDAQVQFLLGSVYLVQRRHAAAVELLQKAAARAGSAEVLRALAQGQMGLGMLDAGQASLEKALAAEPGDAQAGMALASLYMRRGFPARAVQTTEAIAKAQPDNLEVLNFLGAIRADAGDKAGARVAYSLVLNKDPAFTPAVFNLARLDASQGRFDDGRRRLLELLAKRNDDLEVLFELGQFEQRALRPAEAARYWEKANTAKSGDPRPGLALVDMHIGQRLSDKALATASALATRFPNNLAVQLALGRAYLAAGNADAARSTYRKVTAGAVQDAAAQLETGRLQLGARDPDGAIASAQRVLQLDPDQADALALLVDAEAMRGDTARADAALKALLQKHPNSTVALRTSANLAMARGQHASAIAGYRLLLQREPNTAAALNMAQAQVNSGKAGEAVAFLEDWLRKSPDDRTARRALAGVLADTGNFQSARKHYESVLAAEPNDFGSMNNLALVLHRLNDPSAASVAEKALRAMPGSPEIADTLGWILVQQGKIEPGLRHLREARLRRPGNWEIRYHLAFALAKAGRSAEARDELTAALAARGRLPMTSELAQLKAQLVP